MVTSTQPRGAAIKAWGRGSGVGRVVRVCAEPPRDLKCEKVRPARLFPPVKCRENGRRPGELGEAQCACGRGTVALDNRAHRLAERSPRGLVAVPACPSPSGLAPTTTCHIR